MVFLDSDWIAHEEKLGIAPQTDNPAYSDGNHRHIQYSVSGFTLPSRANGASLTAS
jgi:hypothetical protein